MSNWISVEDEIPNDCATVVGAEFDSGRNFGLAKCFYNYRNEKWVLDKDCYNSSDDAEVRIGFKVTHWMPLPEPPNK